jgi:hypothetical protein
MTRKELQSKVEKYIYLNADIESKIAQAINSGAIDVESIEPETYAEVKAIAHAVLLSVASDFAPLTTESKKISENLQLFI